jgi:hypothetical protein
MATTPTNKPIPSEDPRDLKFNAGKIDEEVNGSADYYTDRFGMQRLTNTGRNNQFQEAQDQRESDFVASQVDKEARFQQFLLSSGYQFLGDYENGPYTIAARNQIIRYQNEFWRLNASTNPPYTTTGVNSTSWATDVTHLVSVGDANLRQELYQPTGLGLIGQCSTISALRNIAFNQVGQQVFVKEHTSGQNAGGGIFYCHALTSSSEVDDNGFQIINNFGQVIRRKDPTILSAEMFGYIPDFNGTTQTGTDNAPAIRNAIKAAITFKYTKVVLPAGAALVDVTSADINLGGQGYSGVNGVRVQGQGQQSTRLFVRGPLNSVCFSNIGGSGSSSYKSISGLTLICTTDSTRNVILYRMQGCCMSHNHDLYILNGLIGVQYYNAPSAGTFTEFNTLSYSRVQGCLYNISFDVNGGDNSFHGNSFVNVQNQILAGATYGAGVRVLGSTAPAYLYNQTWDMKFFGGTNCRAFLLTNCNTDNLYGNLTFEGNIICETTDDSYFEFKGNLAGISGTTFTVATPTTTRAANFVFNNTLSNFSAFTNGTLSSYSPRLYNPELADTTDNGVSASLWRVRNSTGDGILFNSFSGSPGWFFTTTAVNQRIQSASPKYSFGPDGNNITAYSATLYLNPNNSTYGVQLSAENARFSPREDNVMSCGSGGFRWTQLFATNSTIGTSDKRKKTNLRQIYDAEVDAFYEIGLLDSVWQWLEKYQIEGDDARLHSGPTVQDAIAIMEDYGLDWSSYACFVHTSIPEHVDAEGIAQPAVDEYAFRKEELLFWISRSIVAKQQDILARLDALEAK